MSPRSICSNPFFVASASNDKSEHSPNCTSSNNSTTTLEKTSPTAAMAPKDDDIPRTRTEPRPDFSKPLPRKALPAELQSTLDNEEKLWETLYDGSAPESTDSSLRYAGYASRVRTILMSAHRYVAYTSDIGESFRPVAHPWLIKGAYGVSWAYLAGDVAHEGYKAYLRNQRVENPDTDAAKQFAADHEPRGEAVTTMPKGVDVTATGTEVGFVRGVTVPAIEDYRAVMAQRAVFQGLASMGLPAFTIHSIVKYSGRALKDVKNVKLRTYGPIGVSLYDSFLSGIYLLTCLFSWVLLLCLHSRTCSMSLSSTLSSGSSTRALSSSAVQMPSRAGPRLAERTSCNPRPRSELGGRRSYNRIEYPVYTREGTFEVETHRSSFVAGHGQCIYV